MDQTLTVTSSTGALHATLGGEINIHEFTVNSNLDDTRANRATTLDRFNKWVERFVKVSETTGAAASEPLFKRVEEAGSVPRDIDEIKKVGLKFAIRGKSPVFGKVKDPNMGDAAGKMDFFAPEHVKNHHFIWAAWADHTATKLDDNQMVPEAFEKDVATTLSLMKPLLVADNAVLSLSVPAEFMPSEGAEENAFRQSWLKVLNTFTKENRIHVIVAGLRERVLDEDLKDQVVEVDEVKIVKDMNNLYLHPTPRDNQGTDLIYTAEKFMNEVLSGNLADQPLVTMIPGHSWNHIGADAQKTDEAAKNSVEGRLAVLSPMISNLFNVATNKYVRALLSAKIIKRADWL